MQHFSACQSGEPQGVDYGRVQLLWSSQLNLAALCSQLPCPLRILYLKIAQRLFSSQRALVSCVLHRDALPANFKPDNFHLRRKQPVDEPQAENCCSGSSPGPEQTSRAARQCLADRYAKRRDPIRESCSSQLACQRSVMAGLTKQDISDPSYIGAWAAA